jgi:hypothetical protein
MAQWYDLCRTVRVYMAQWYDLCSLSYCQSLSGKAIDGRARLLPSR